MSVPAWDLDAPADAEPVATGFRLGPVLLLAIALTGAGLGALIGSAVAPAEPPRSPATATLSIRDFYVDPALSTSDSASAKTSNPRAGAAIVVLRLQVDNPRAGTIRLTTLVLQGVARTSIQQSLDALVAGHDSATVDVTVTADCSLDREPLDVRGWLRLTGPGGSDPEVIRVAPSRALARTGGLCSEVNTELPNGWRTPLQASSTHLDGPDLEITIGNLPTARLAGILVDNQLLTSVYVGNQLLSSSVQPQAGDVTRLRLRGPPPCIQFSGATPIPATLRLLAEGEGGIQQRLVIVGPALTRWLRLDCGA